MTTPPPPMFGRYEVIKLLGRGAMGLVYRAKDPRLGREVALKTLAPGLLGGEQAESIKERFLNEGRAAGRLRHPAIVSIYDADEDPTTGAAYLAMEFIEGTELRKRMKEGMPVEELVSILAEVADALHHAHERGVIHRDVKPANVLLDAAGKPHLTDFGIARLGDSNLTQSGEFLGTPAYMAPEQVRGRPVSAKTDVYALGVILYEGLTGSRPFSGDSMVATATSIASDVPAPPSAVGATTSAFDAMVMKALEKDPDDRQESAAVFAEEMKRALEASRTDTATRISGAPPPAASARPASPRDSRGLKPVWIGLGALVALVVAIFLITSGDSADSIPDGEPETTAADGASPATAAGRTATAPRRTATAPVRATAAPLAVPMGSVAVRAQSPRTGVLTIRDAGTEIGRVDLSGKRKGLKAMQVESSGTFRLPAGERTLSFTFVPEDGKVLTEGFTLDVKVGGKEAVFVDVGTLGRKLQVRRDD